MSLNAGYGSNALPLEVVWDAELGLSTYPWHRPTTERWSEGRVFGSPVRRARLTARLSTVNNPTISHNTMPGELYIDLGMCYALTDSLPVSFISTTCSTGIRHRHRRPIQELDVNPRALRRPGRTFRAWVYGITFRTFCGWIQRDEVVMNKRMSAVAGGVGSELCCWVARYLRRRPKRRNLTAHPPSRHNRAIRAPSR